MSDQIKENSKEEVTSSLSLDNIIKQKSKKPKIPVNITGQINDDLGNRPVRRPLDNINPIGIPERPGYHRRIVNYSTPGNYENALEIGYLPVEGNVNTGINLKTHDFSQLGGYMTKHLGGGDIGIVMEIPIEKYHERLMEKREIRKKELSGIKKPEGFSENLFFGDINIGEIES